MGNGVSFAGNGMMDTSDSRPSTIPSQPADSSEKVVDFAGHGGEDVSKAFGTKTPSGKADGSGVEFSGNV